MKRVRNWTCLRECGIGAFARRGQADGGYTTRDCHGGRIVLLLSSRTRRKCIKCQITHVWFSNRQRTVNIKGKTVHKDKLNFIFM